MALDIGPLHEVPVFRTAVTVYVRQVMRPGDGTPPDPFFVRNEGRWPTDWTLYTATTPAVAWAEYCRNHATDVDEADVTGGTGLDEAGLGLMGHLEVPVAARAYFELEYQFDVLADLTGQWAQELLERAGFVLESFTADPPYGDCPALAALAAELGWQAIKVPSAAWQRASGFCVPIFAAGREGLVGQRMTHAAARPNVFVAAATHYVTGERPRWLPDAG